jgi:hypothetical protein
MAAEWYYTTNKQQMGPVSWDELQQLATQGLLRPNDLVWTDGMPEWVKATAQAGLFAQPAALAAGASRVELVEPPPLPRSATRERIDAELDEHEREDRRERRRARRGGGGGLKIALTVGGILVGLALFLSCIGLVVGGIIWWVMEAPSGNQNYTVNVAPGAHSDRTIRAKANQRVRVELTTPNAGPLPTVGVHILRNGAVIASPEAVGGNLTLNWTAPADDRYTVRVVNRGPGFAHSRVRITFN